MAYVPKCTKSNYQYLPPSHAPTTSAPTKQPSGNATSLAHKPRLSMVRIVSPSNGEQVLVGEPLLIFGTSAGNAIATSINCKVSVSLNGIKPYQRVIATGPNSKLVYSTI